MLQPDDVLADPERLAAVREIRDLGPAPRAAFDRLARLAAMVLDSPVALVTLVGDTQFIAGRYGVDDVPDAVRHVATDCTLCPVVVALGKPLLVEDTRTDPRFAIHPACARDGLVAYAGSPIRETGGRVIGSLCVVALEPRKWSDRDRLVLDAIARSVTTEVVLYQDMDRRRRLLDAFDAAPVAVAVTRSVEHVVEYLNPVYREVFGDSPTGVPGREAFPELAAQGFFAILDRVLATGQTHRAHEESHPAGGSEQRYFDLSCSAIGAGAGQPYGVLIVAAEVTTQVQARRAVEARADRQEAAAKATAAVSRSLDPETELDALARSVVPILADVCGVYLLDHPVPPGRRPALPVRTTRVTAVGPPGITLPSAPQPGLAWPGDDILTDAITAGRPVCTTINPDRLPQWAPDVGVAQLWRSTGVHSVVTVPVITGGLVLAVVSYIAFRERPSYTGDDLALLQQIGLRASVAIGHGVAYQRSREHALALQRSMLTEPPDVPGLQLAASYRPAGQDAEVGGDWYDAFLLPAGDLAVVIGDVVGHDMAAAASMGQLRSMLRALAVDTDGPPNDVLARLDRLACGLEVTSFATLLYGRIRRIASQHMLCWSNAGHPAPLLLDSDGRGRLLTEARGLVLGAQPDVNRSCQRVPLPPGSTLLLYTDGLTERRGGRPDDDVLGRAGTLARLPLNELCDELLTAAPPHDDIALLAVRAEPSGAE
ncbi:MAG: SpoIIE family protein phosphatase, partial [Pseudonocardiaceae bacterium]